MLNIGKSLSFSLSDLLRLRCLVLIFYWFRGYLFHPRSRFISFCFFLFLFVRFFQASLLVFYLLSVVKNYWFLCFFTLGLKIALSYLLYVLDLVRVLVRFHSRCQVVFQGLCFSVFCSFDGCRLLVSISWSCVGVGLRKVTIPLNILLSRSSLFIPRLSSLKPRILPILHPRPHPLNLLILPKQAQQPFNFRTDILNVANSHLKASLSSVISLNVFTGI